LLRECHVLEGPGLAEGCARAGITFVGPPADILKLAGNKARAAIAAARAAGLPVLASSEPSADPAILVQTAGALEFPLFVKAVAGEGEWPFLPAAASPSKGSAPTREPLVRIRRRGGTSGRIPDSLTLAFVRARPGKAEVVAQSAPGVFGAIPAVALQDGDDMVGERCQLVGQC
jgi:hypothetical protein